MEKTSCCCWTKTPLELANVCNNTPPISQLQGFTFPSKVGLSQRHLLLWEVQVPWPSKLASGRPVSRWKHHPNLKTNRLIRISQLHWVHSLLVLTWTEVQQAFWKRCLGLQEWQSAHRGLCAKGGWVWIHQVNQIWRVCVCFCRKSQQKRDDMTRQKNEINS